MKYLMAGAVLSFAAGTLVIQALGAQEPAPVPEPTSSPSASADLPQLDPGRYEVVMRLNGLSGRLEPEMAQGLKALGQQREMKRMVCIREGAGQRLPFFDNAPDSCRQTALTRQGDRISGEFSCADSQSRGGIAFSGTATHEALDLALDIRFRTKAASGPVGIAVNIAMTRSADQCEPGDPTRPG